MFGLQPIHLVLILIIALVIFGPKRLPELGQSLGKSINEFRNATKDVQEPLNEAAATVKGTPAPQAKNTEEAPKEG